MRWNPRLWSGLSAVLAPALVVGALACTKSPELKSMTVDQVAALVTTHGKDGTAFFFDDNPKEVYTAGHIPGAHWVAADEPTQAELPADKKATLVFYCASEL